MKVQNVTNKNKTLEENMDYFKVWTTKDNKSN